MAAATRKKEAFYVSNVILLCATSGKRDVDYFAIYVHPKFDSTVIENCVPTFFIIK